MFDNIIIEYNLKYLLFAVLPTSVQLVRPEEPLSVSKSVVLVCKSLGSRPPATITWWKKGKFMGKAPEEVSMFTFVHTYIYDKVNIINYIDTSICT